VETLAWKFLVYLEQYNCKKEAMRNNPNGGGKIKGRGKLTAAAICR
jgi:hypothetical protein